MNLGRWVLQESEVLLESEVLPRGIHCFPRDAHLYQSPTAGGSFGPLSLLTALRSRGRLPIFLLS